MISADSGLTERGVEALFGMRDRARPDRGARDLVEFALPLEFGLAQALRISCAASAKRGRASPIGMRNPSYSTLAAPRPKPNRQRPPHRMSSSAISSATRIGSCHGSTMTAVPNVIALGAAGVIGQQLERRRRHRIAGEMVLEREQRVEAERLGEVAHRQMVRHDRHVGAAGLGQHVERNADFHRWFSSAHFASFVTPRKAGVQGDCHRTRAALDSRFRGNDG